MTWLDGAERVPNGHAAGGTYVPGVPWRLVLHSTEVVPSTVADARKMAARHEAPPHLWAWPVMDWLGQTVPLDRSAFALAHPKGTPETNKMRAIQVEVVGMAADTQNWPLEWWEWLGRRVLAPVVRAGYPIYLDRLGATTGTDGYGTNGRVRMSRAEWRHSSGLFVHANVPDNTHWDAGLARLDLIAAGAKKALAPQPPAPIEEDDDMPLDPARVQLDRQQLIDDWYADLVGRPVDEPTRRSIMDQLDAGTPPEKLRRSIYASPEAAAHRAKQAAG